MKLSQLIKILRNAKADFGDVPVKLMDSETGDWNSVTTVLKLHPYTAPHGCLNRAEPVNAIAITCQTCGSADLTLGVATP